MATVEERTAFAKLEALKEIRSKTVSLEKLRNRLLHDMDSFENEDKCLAEYRREMELLQQEKMAHVEELRQIHADINAMETVMKQAEEAKRSSIDSARRAFEDYQPLKHEVDLMRTELLGLEKLPELPEEEKEKLGGLGIMQKPKSFMDHPGNPWHHPMAGHAHHQQLAAAAQMAAAQMAANSAGGGGNDDKPFSAMMAARAHHQSMTGGPGGPNPFLAAAAAQHSAMGLGPLPGPGSKVMSSHSSGSAPPPFRQQPPPMKSCLSCHQQIHRNAPICPLCKAKSRSRNPKKPKKKE